jgi:hypothetical protein
MNQRNKIFLHLLLALISFPAGAQILTFSFSGNNGDEINFPSSSNSGGIQASVISRGPNIAAAASGDRFNSINWTTGATPDLNGFIEYTIIPAGGYKIDITSIQLQHRRSSTGPRKFIIRTSVDGFTTDASGELTVPDVNTQQNNSLALLMPLSTTAPVTFRIYGYAAETTSGSWGPGEDTGADINVYGTLRILPVRFIHIKAADVDGVVKLSWANAAETGVRHYIVEHSTGGQRFHAAGTTSPVYNNGQEARYTYLHIAPATGVNYYRLKAVELDGTIVYSTIIKLNLSSSSKLIIRSNPVDQGRLNFGLADLAAGSYEVIIYNGAGQVIQKENLKHTGGSYVSSAALNNPGKGIHFLEIAGGVKLHKQFVVR